MVTATADPAAGGDGAGVPRRPRVVVIGAGHAGLEIARGLRREDVDVLVVDRHNYHTFQPLLYQVATAGLQPGDIAQPVRHILQRYRNVGFRLGEVVGVDLRARNLALADGTQEAYDWLVVAAGATTTFFGVPGADEFALPLKTLANAIEIRRRVLAAFEQADRARMATPGAAVPPGLTTVAVVGGGATGVETAGAFAELFDRVLVHDYPGLDFSQARVIVIEAGEGLLDAYRPHIGEYARRTLERRRVEFRFGAGVTRVDEHGVELSSGERLPAATVVWAAGVRAHPLGEILGVGVTRGGCVAVDDTLQVPGHPEVMVIGDLAGAAAPDGTLYPQVAQVAIQQGRLAARQIRRALRGLDPLPFRYRDLGNMATVGRNAAVLQTPGGRTLTGFIAWVGWLFVHVINLVGLRNRLQVMVSWLYNYLTYDRGPRLIFPPSPADGARKDPMQ